MTAPEQLDDLVAGLDRRSNDRYHDETRVFRISDADKMKRAADAITDLRAEIARLTAERDAALAAERAATIEAAARICWAQAKRRADQLANLGFFGVQRARWVAGRIQAEQMAQAIEDLHTEATRMAMEPQPITVQDAARVLAEAINNDMVTFNKALGTLTARKDMPTQHFFAEAILAYATALRAIAEQESR